MTSTVELRAAIPASLDEALATAADLAAAFRDGAARRDAERILPGEEVEDMTRRGLYGLTVPAWLGGPDLPMSAVAEVLRILATGDPNLAQLPHSHYVYVNLLRCCGSRDQQRELLSAVRDGVRFGNAQAEAGTRTPDQIRTSIVPDGGGYVITGEKFYCTGAWFAHIIPVLARGQDGAACVAFVPRNARGLTVLDDWAGLGQRTTASGTVRLEGVRVGPGAVVARGPVFGGPTTYGAFAQLMHAAIDAGIARGALDEAAAFVRTKARPWFEAGVEKAVDDPLLVQRAGELAVTVRAAETLLADAGRQLDAAEAERAAGRLDAQQAGAASIAVAIAKAAADRAAVDAASALFELGGTRSATAGLNLDRHWRNARTHTLHDPVRWKLQHIGRWTLTGTTPPRHGQL